MRISSLSFNESWNRTNEELDFEPTIEIRTSQKKRKREVSIKGDSLEQSAD